MGSSAWAWIEHDGHVQPKVYTGVDEALEDMRGRLGDPDISLERLADVGFRLAIVEITFRALYVLEKLP